MKLLIVGGVGGTHIANSFYKAAIELNWTAKLIDAQPAYNAPFLIKQFNWRLRKKRPSGLSKFSKKVVDECAKFRPDVLVATGFIAAINEQGLQQIKQMGVQSFNYLTDDPWNPDHFAPWFFKALLYYDCICSPRHANITDLQQLGCKEVRYLPFGYDPDLFFIEKSKEHVESTHYSCDIMFAGGADRERIPYMDTLIRSGFQVALYGAYWERYSETKAHSRGYADPRMLRLATSEAKVVLCIVRHSNRDGHSMRTFEAPAMGGSLLVENTREHQSIFGNEGSNVIYFSSLEEMVEKTRWLLENPLERKRLADAVYRHITQGNHTYKDRLVQMLSNKL